MTLLDEAMALTDEELLEWWSELSEAERVQFLEALEKTWENIKGILEPIWAAVIDDTNRYLLAYEKLNKNS